MYSIVRSKKFERSFKRLSYSGTKDSVKRELAIVIDMIASKKALPEKYKDHQLKGEFKAYRECHVRPDLLLVYEIQDTELVLLLVDIGSHAYFF